MAWLPDREVYGPERPQARDIDPLNRVFAESFTDRYRRDGMTGVRVPHLNPVIWRYALEDAGDGAMIWRDGDGELCAFNMVHLSGREGWMGPLAVRPDQQAAGLGKVMLKAGIAWLKERGARTIGLETMPRTVENIGFYSRLGFVPGPLTVSLVRDLARRPVLQPEFLAALGNQRQERLRACAALTERLLPGADYTRELLTTAELRIGDTLVLRDPNGDLAGFALFHTAPLAAGRPRTNSASSSSWHATSTPSSASSPPPRPLRWRSTSAASPCAPRRPIPPPTSASSSSASAPTGPTCA